MFLQPACAKDPFRPWPASKPTPYYTVDLWQTWSHDGRWIAFQRRFPSSYGPAGVYVVNSAGGVPRFLTPGNLVWPEHLRFSPDGRYLAAVDDFRLLLIDVASASVTRPAAVDTYATSADWSPDGGTIVYSGVGLFLFELASGTVRELRRESGGLIPGYMPRWSSDGSLIAFIEGTTSTPKISVIRPDGGGYRSLVESSDEILGESSEGIVNDLQWYVRPAQAVEKIVFRLTGLGQRPELTFSINRDGSGLARFPRQILPYDSFSPDGEEICFTAFAADTMDVLFVGRVDDFSGATRRQLTSWAPPPSEHGARLRTSSSPPK